MKQVALARKTWLFIGSMAAGARAADFLTLVSRTAIPVAAGGSVAQNHSKCCKPRT